MDGIAQRNLEPTAVDVADELPIGVARHRRHRFPARTESVRARYAVTSWRSWLRRRHGRG